MANSQQPQLLSTSSVKAATSSCPHGTNVALLDKVGSRLKQPSPTSSCMLNRRTIFDTKVITPDCIQISTPHHSFHTSSCCRLLHSFQSRTTSSKRANDVLHHPHDRIKVLQLIRVGGCYSKPDATPKVMGILRSTHSSHPVRSGEDFNSSGSDCQYHRKLFTHLRLAPTLYPLPFGP